MPLWGMGLTGLGIISVIFFGVSSIIRANKKDIAENIDRLEAKKVDMTLFEETIQAIEDRISDNKDNVKEHFDLLRRDIGILQVDIKEILRSINGKKK